VTDVISRNALDIERARAELRRLRHRRNDGLGVMPVLVLAAAIFAVTGEKALAGSAAAGALAALVVGAVAAIRRQDLLTELVAQGDVRSLPSVDRHARRLVSPRGRARLAASIQRAVEAPSLIPLRRIDVARSTLRRLATCLLDPSVPVEPAAAALAHRMMTDGARSPLLNDRIPEHDLRRLLAAIEAGTRPHA
jgi:hypothetical protein